MLHSTLLDFYSCKQQTNWISMKGNAALNIYLKLNMEVKRTCLLENNPDQYLLNRNFHCPTNTPVTLYVLDGHMKTYCHITLMLHSTCTVQLLQCWTTNRADDHRAPLSSKDFIHSSNGIILWPSFQWVLEWIIKQNSLQFFHQPST